MTPEPPPIAAPHSMTPLPPKTEPRTLGTVVLGLVHVALGAPLFILAAGLALTLASDVLRGEARSDYVLFLGVFVFLVGGLGFVLLGHGLRIWKHGQ